MGTAAARFGWSPGDLDAIAGAMAAGHVIECGTQATGGNYAFFPAIGDLRHPGFPIAEVEADGTSVITKPAGTGGAVTVGTVTAQLLYEVGGARYAGPDAVLRLDSITLSPDGPDRVRMSGVRGEPPPDTLKVGVTALGGYRNEVTFVLTGLDIEAKADLVRSQLASAVPDGTTWTLARTDHRDADTTETASALLHCVARGKDPDAVGRRFSDSAVHLALGSYPGFHLTAPPGAASPYGVFLSANVAPRLRCRTSPSCLMAAGSISRTRRLRWPLKRRSPPFRINPLIIPNGGAVLPVGAVRPGRGRAQRGQGRRRQRRRLGAKTTGRGRGSRSS